MADNVLGSGDSGVTLGLGVDLQLNNAVSDAGAFANQLEEVIKDMQTISSLTADTSEKLREIVQGVQEEGSALQQLIGFEQELRSISEQRLMTVQQTVMEYERMEQITGRIQLLVGGVGGSGGTQSQLGALPASVQDRNQYAFQTPGSLYSQSGGVPQAAGGESLLDSTPSGTYPNLSFPEATARQRRESGGGLEEPSFGPAEEQAERSFLPAMLGNLAGRLPSSGLLGKVREAALKGSVNFLGKDVGLGSLAEVGLGVGAVAGAGYLGYQGIGDLLRQGQQYSALTGGTSVSGALSYDAQALLSGINPLLGYGTAKQIIQAGLQQGYGGTALQGQYTGFADQAVEQYGISPQQSMGLFQSGIIQAGGSVANLSTALAGLASAATNHAGSFQQMAQSFGSNLSTLAGLGAGSLSSGVAENFSKMLQGNPALRGINVGSFVDSQLGQALFAQQLGTTPTGLYSTLQNLNKTGDAGVARETDAVQSAVKSIITPILHGTSNADINQQALQLQAIYGQLGWNLTQNQAVKMTEDFYHHDPAGTAIKTSASAYVGKNLGTISGAALGNQDAQVLTARLSAIAAAQGSPELAGYIHTLGNTIGTAHSNQYVRTAGPHGHIEALSTLLDNTKTNSATWNALRNNQLEIGTKEANGSYSNFQTLQQQQGQNLGAINPAMNFGSAAQQHIISLSPAAQKLFTLINKDGIPNASIRNAAGSGAASKNTQSTGRPSTGSRAAPSVK